IWVALVMPRLLRVTMLFLLVSPAGLTLPSLPTVPLTSPLPWNVASAAAQVCTRPPALGLSQANSGVLVACTVSSRGTAPNPWASAITLVSLIIFAVAGGLASTSMAAAAVTKTGKDPYLNIFDLSSGLGQGFCNPDKSTQASSMPSQILT